MRLLKCGIYRCFLLLLSFKFAGILSTFAVSRYLPVVLFAFLSAFTLASFFWLSFLQGTAVCSSRHKDALFNELESGNYNSKRFDLGICRVSKMLEEEL